MSRYPVEVLCHPAGGPGIRVTKKELKRLLYLRLAFPKVLLSDPDDGRCRYVPSDLRRIASEINGTRTAACPSCGAKNGVTETHCHECNHPDPGAFERFSPPAYT